MNIKILIILLFSLLTFNTKSIEAQCIDFVKTKGFQILDTVTYVPEGRFDAMQLSEGDYLNVYKSFFRGKSYRIVVIGDEVLPELQFTIKDMTGNIIYDNTKDASSSGNPKNWDYTSDRNQNLMISLKIPGVVGSLPKTGCVAVVLGYKFK